MLVEGLEIHQNPPQFVSLKKSRALPRGFLRPRPRGPPRLTAFMEGIATEAAVPGSYCSLEMLGFVVRHLSNEKCF